MEAVKLLLLLFSTSVTCFGMKYPYKQIEKGFLNYERSPTFSQNSVNCGLQKAENCVENFDSQPVSSLPGCLHGGRRTWVNQTLPHVAKWPRLENKSRQQLQNWLFVGYFTTSRLKREHLWILNAR